MKVYDEAGLPSPSRYSINTVLTGSNGFPYQVSSKRGKKFWNITRKNWWETSILFHTKF